MLIISRGQSALRLCKRDYLFFCVKKAAVEAADILFAEILLFHHSLMIGLDFVQSFPNCCPLAL